MNLRRLPFALACGLIIGGCGSVKLHQMVMYDDLGTEKLPIDSIPELRIMPLDIIGVQVSSNDIASVLVFQQQHMASPSTGSATGSASAVTAGAGRGQEDVDR